MLGFFMLGLRMWAGAIGMLGRAGSSLFSARQSSQSPQELFRQGRARGMSLDALYRAGRDRGMSRTDMLRLAYAEKVPLKELVPVALDDGMDSKDLLELGKAEGIPESRMVQALLACGRSVREVFSLQSVAQRVTDTFESELAKGRSIETALKNTYTAHLDTPGDVANLATKLGAESKTLEQLGLGQYHVWCGRFARKQVSARVLEEAVAQFHGNPFELGAALAGMRRKGFPCSSPGRPHEMQTREATHAKVVADLKATFRGLDARKRTELMENAVGAWLDGERGGKPTWKALAHSRDEALDALLAPVFSSYVNKTFASDPDADKVTEGMRSILGNLPSSRRLRLMASVIADGPFKSTEDLVYTLIKAAGTGAVKCGQHMSENQAIPERFRKAMEPLRDDNTALTKEEVTGRADAAVLKRVEQIGARVGTGSAKQVNHVVDKHGKKLDLCVTLPGGLEAFYEIRDACKDVPFLKNILGRLTPVLEREFDLRSEHKAFDEVRASRLGRCDYIQVPEVVASAKSSLLREHVDGDTLATVLRASKGKLPNLLRPLISRFHEDLIKAAFPRKDDQGGLGLVMTDPHDANFTVIGGARIGLFDVGQREFLSYDEGTLFLVLLAQFSTDKPNAEATRRLATSLVSCCEHGKLTPAAATTELEHAFAQVQGRDLNPGRKLLAWFECAASRGVHVPVAFVGLAKMLDTLTNREMRMGLEAKVAPTLARLIQKRLASEPVAGTTPAPKAGKPDIALKMPFRINQSEARERLQKRLKGELGGFGIKVTTRPGGDLQLVGSGLSDGVNGVVGFADKMLSVSVDLGSRKAFAPMIRGLLGTKLAAALA